MNDPDTETPEETGPQKRVDENWKKQVARERAQEEAKTRAEESKQRTTPQEPDSQQPTGPPEGSRFAEFVAGLAMQAMMAMGQMPNPNTGVATENLGEAKYLVDIIGMLQEKTKGNLNPEEAAAIEETVYSLRMVYVRKASGPAQPPPQQQ